MGRPAASMLPDDAWPAVHARIAAGESIRAVAASIGYSEMWVSKKLHRLGLRSIRRPIYDTTQTDADAAYLAGIFDGEGTANVVMMRKGGWYVPRLAVTNTNEAVVRRIQARWGGYVVFTKRRNAKWKDCWRWEIRSKVEHAARRMLPWLTVKRQQVVLIIDLCWSIRAHKGPAKVKHCGIPIDELQHRAWIREEIMRLNDRADKRARSKPSFHPAAQRRDPAECLNK